MVIIEYVCIVMFCRRRSRATGNNRSHVTIMRKHLRRVFVIFGMYIENMARFMDYRCSFENCMLRIRRMDLLVLKEGISPERGSALFLIAASLGFTYRITLWRAL